MEFLSYGDDCDDDKECEGEKFENLGDQEGAQETEDVVNLEKRWARDYDDSDDETDEESDGVNKGIERENEKEMASKTTGLISMKELLERDISFPTYLKANDVEEFQVKITAPRKESPPQTSLPTLPKSAPPVPIPIPIPIPIIPVSKGHENKIPPSKRKEIQSKEQIKKSETTNKRKGQNNSTIKDQIKNQRKSGQSGIGSDFKEWRSEEEMRLRQHYD